VSVDVALDEYFDNVDGLDFFFRADNSVVDLVNDYYPDGANNIAAHAASRFFSGKLSQ